MIQQTTEESANQPVDVLGIGGSLFDTFFVVQDYPVEDTKLKAKATLNQCGGPVATALTAVSKLGLSCAFVGTMDDVFHGAAIYARLQGWDWPEVFSFASAVAALKCMKLGGQTGIPTRQEVDDYLQVQRGAM